MKKSKLKIIMILGILIFIVFIKWCIDSEIKFRVIAATKGYEFANVATENLIVVKQGGKYGYINTKGNEIIACVYEEVNDFYDGLARVKRDGKYGYINTKGEEIIFCIYEEAPISVGGAFSKDKNGYEYVGINIDIKLERVKKDGKYGYINRERKEIIECVYESAGNYHDGLARVKKDGKYGYINTEGKYIIESIYEQADDFNEGIARVKKDGKYGYINTKGEEIIECIYNRASRFSKGLAIVDAEGLWGSYHITIENGQIKSRVFVKSEPFTAE